jgi:hypothetical protein
LLFVVVVGGGGVGCRHATRRPRPLTSRTFRLCSSALTLIESMSCSCNSSSWSSTSSCSAWVRLRRSRRVLFCHTYMAPLPHGSPEISPGHLASKGRGIVVGPTGVMSVVVAIVSWPRPSPQSLLAMAQAPGGTSAPSSTPTGAECRGVGRASDSIAPTLTSFVA